MTSSTNLWLSLVDHTGQDVKMVSLMKDTAIAISNPITNLTPYRYQAKLARRPLLTQSITTAVSPCVSKTASTSQTCPNTSLPQILFATGDVMAQHAVERVGLEKHNYARTGRMALYGGGKSQDQLRRTVSRR